jgi:hypothetical protein
MYYLQNEPLCGVGYIRYNTEANVACEWLVNVLMKTFAFFNNLKKYVNQHDFNMFFVSTPSFTH